MCTARIMKSDIDGEISSDNSAQKGITIRFTISLQLYIH